MATKQQALWLLGRSDGSETVEDISADTALELVRVTMPQGRPSPVRAGFWVGVMTNAPSSLTIGLRTRDGHFRDGTPTSQVGGFPLAMLDLEAEPAQIVDLRVPLPGLEDLLEWPEYLVFLLDPAEAGPTARRLLALADGLTLRVLVGDLTGDDARAALDAELDNLTA